jgi:hypothetical protein
MDEARIDFFEKHFIETSDGRRWMSLRTAYSPVMRLSAIDTKTGQKYPPEELQRYAPCRGNLQLGAVAG